MCLLPLLFFAALEATAGTADRDVAVIEFDPITARLSATQTATLDVVYDGAYVTAGLRGYHLEISYDDTYVYVDSLEVHVTEGDFLSDVGGTAFYVLPVDGNTFEVDCAILGATSGATGTGTLCSITFKGKSGDGTSVVEFDEIRLRDPDNGAIDYTDGAAVLILDNTPPNVPVLDPEPEFTQGTTNYVSWSDESATGAVGYCIEASETPTFDVVVGTSGCTPWTYHTFMGLTDGQLYYYRVKCRDDLWNESDWSALEYSTQDDTAPDTEAGPVDPYYGTVSFDVPYVASDATSGVQHVMLFYQQDGGGYVQFGGTYTSSPIAFTAPGEGVYDFYTIGTDNVDNVELAPVDADCTAEVDMTRPLAPIDLVALPGHNKIHLSWTVPTSRDAPVEGTLIVRRPWSLWAYPEYDDLGPPFGYPINESNGFQIAFVPGTGPQTYTDVLFTDTSRNVHYYTVFTRDVVGNYSLAASTAQDRATSYWLADVRDTSSMPGAYDGLVDYYDKVAYSYSYYSSDGELRYRNELDVGPTDDNSRMGIPLTDDVIDFEDLMILAMNYGRVSPTRAPVQTEPAVPSWHTPELALEWGDAEVAVGDVFDVTLVVRGEEGLVKGLSSAVTFDQDILEFVSAAQANSHELGESFFWAEPEGVGRVRVDLAALGAETTLPGGCRVVTLRFKLNIDDSTSIDIEDVSVRDLWNAEVSCEVSGLRIGDDELPVAVRLGQNAPNPFNPMTTVSFDVPERCRVLLKVYSVDGREISTLLDGERDAGTHDVVWRGTDDAGVDVASGVYFCVLEARDLRLTRKMVLMR